MTKKKGFTFVEGMVGLTILSLSTACITATAVGLGRLSNANMSRQAREQERTMNQEVAALGYAPEKLRVSPLAGASSFNTETNSDALVINRAGAARIVGLTASLDDGRSAIGARASAMGLQISTAADAVAATMALSPPSFSLADNTTPAAFPISNLILANGANPPGTFYVYTTDGSSPTAASPRWNSSITFDVTTFPRVVMAQAYHPDPSYLASSVVTLTLAYPASSYAFRRNDDSTGREWNYLQVIQNSNGLKPAFYDTAYNAVLTFANGGASQTHTVQTSVFNPSIAAFIGAPPNGTVQIIIRPKNTNFTSTSSTTYNEAINGTPITLPGISTP
jgi:hypothetical protein